jgi:hypothetical protein
LYKVGTAVFQVKGTVQGSYDIYGGSVRLQSSAANSLGGYLGTVTNHALNFATKDVVRMTITNTGNVGIGTATPSSTFDLHGSFELNLVNKSTNYTAASETIINCTANTFAVTLPTAVGVDGRHYVVKNSGTGVITVSTTSSQTIDGQLTQSLNQHDSISVVSDGTNWIII